MQKSKIRVDTKQLKLCMAIILFELILNVQSKLSIGEIEKINHTFITPIKCSNDFKAYKQKTYINPCGPLNLLRGYLYHTMGYVYNKRCFSPEIQCDYTLSTHPGRPVSSPQYYELFRNPDKDSAYSPISDNSTDEVYLSEFSNCLVNMFALRSPSFIEDDKRPSRFTRFLSCKKLKKHAHYILASIFLSTEGVKVPLFYDGNESTLTLYKNNLRARIFHVQMAGSLLELQKNFESFEVFNKCIDTLDFLMDSKNIEMADAKYSMDIKDKERFDDGYFLNHPHFIIQAYLALFLKKKKDAIKFINAVHELLLDRILDEDDDVNSKQKLEKVFSECFVFDSENNEYRNNYDAIEEMELEINKRKAMPFHNSYELSLYRNKAIVKRKKGEEELDEKLPGTNGSVETALLGLLYIGLYNFNTGTHEHASWTSSEKSIELNSVAEMITRQVYPSPKLMKSWWSYLRSMNTGGISYKPTSSLMNNGILNMLRAILYMTNAHTNYKKELEKIADSLIRTESSKKYTMKEINRKLVKMFNLLENDKTDFRVKSLQIDEFSNTQGASDLFGKVFFSYMENKKKIIVTLDISQNATVIYFAGDSVKEIINRSDINTLFTKKKCFFHCLLVKYAEYIKNGSRLNSSCVMDINRKLNGEIGVNYSHNTNRLFLLGPIKTIECKDVLITNAIVYCLIKCTDRNSPRVRFISNLVASLFSADRRYMQHILQRIICSKGIEKGFYPNIKIEEEEYYAGSAQKDEIQEIFRHIADTKNREGLKCILEYAVSVHSYTPEECSNILNSSNLAAIIMGILNREQPSTSSECNSTSRPLQIRES
ncbi:hypothetical protein NEAUS05_0570 [Nematocida ausubeli]|nr:hypothetical protein NEAUS05_0570 [Nematocida ausubeli]